MERTNYFETFQASDENLKWALDLESDRMVNSFIKKEVLDTEMTVVRNEFESGENDPFRVLMERTMAAAYVWHPYGRAVIGNRSDIENVPIDKLKAFYQKFYQPDNAVLTVAGKVDEAKLVPLIAAYFGQIPKPERKLEETYTEEPTQDGEREVTVRRVGNNQGVRQAPIETFLTVWNQDPKPFVWTATVESIQEKLTRCRRTLEQILPGCTSPKTRKQKKRTV